MKLPSSIRRFFRKLLGTGDAPAIDAAALRDLAARESVLVVAMGAIAPGLPGEQVSLRGMELSKLLENVSKDRSIVTHCG